MEQYGTKSKHTSWNSTVQQENKIWTVQGQQVTTYKNISVQQVNKSLKQYGTIGKQNLKTVRVQQATHELKMCITLNGLKYLSSYFF